jgi:hypothetical protein
MTADRTDDLRTALLRATAPVVAPPDLATRARTRVDRRRRRRTRSALVLAPIAVVAVVAAAVLVVPRLARSESLPAADQELLDRPTGGDLAGRSDLLARALEVFLAGVRPGSAHLAVPTAVPGTGAVGAPHVLWAGTTPGGPAAVVVQQERAAGRRQVAIGYLAPGLTLVAVSRPNDQDDLAGAYVGPRTLLVVDRGDPLTWSYTHTYRPGGGIRLTDRPVRFDGGVAVLTVPAGPDPRQVEVTRPGPIGRDRVLRLGGDPGGPGDQERRLLWGSKQSTEEGLFPVTGATAWPEPSGADGGRYMQLLGVLRAGVETVPTDRSLTGSTGDDRWYAYGTTPDGRRLVATDLAAYGDPSRVYAVLLDATGRSTVAVGGPVDRADRLPVRLRLPAGQGWLVAAEGRTLTWPGGTARDAALLPATLTTVRVDGVPVALR